MAYPSFEVTNTFTNGTLADADEVNTNFTEIEGTVNGASALGTPIAIGMAPVGSIIAWVKTFNLVDSGTADTNTVDALEDSGADFVNDGVTAGMVVVNTTDAPDTYAIADVVTAVKVTLKADLNGNSAVTDIFPDGTDAYSIYATPELPDNWLECRGQAISDADSPYNGATLPDLTTTQSFLRGSITSGSTGGADTHALSIAEIPSHTHLIPQGDAVGGSATLARGDPSIGNFSPTSQGSGTAHENMPVYYEVVWIMRIK